MGSQPRCFFEASRRRRLRAISDAGNNPRRPSNSFNHFPLEQVADQPIAPIEDRRCPPISPATVAGRSSDLSAGWGLAMMVRLRSVLANAHHRPRRLSPLLHPRSRSRSPSTSRRLAAGAASVGPYGTRLAGLHIGAFWEPDYPALISLPGPAWVGAR